MSDRLIVGLTGGIGSGKTLVSDTFATLGAHVIDTDVISRELTNQDSSTIKEIQRVLGKEILEDGLINRSVLRELVFNDISAKEKLEKILHPKIRDMVALALKDHIDSYAVVVIPLLTEKGAYPFINRILVVDCDEQPRGCCKRLPTMSNGFEKRIAPNSGFELSQGRLLGELRKMLRKATKTLAVSSSLSRGYCTHR